MPLRKVEFYLQAVDLYTKLGIAIHTKEFASQSLEGGIIAEMQSKLTSKPIRPRLFRTSLQQLGQLKTQLSALDTSIGKLQTIDAACRKTPIGAETIAKIIAQEPPLPRLSEQGVRYADVAGTERPVYAPIRSITDILAALRADLKILQKTLDAVISGLRDAIPLTTKGEFAAVMLSGRNAFGDKMPQFIQMFGAFQSYYIRTVGVTITATMQLYPRGYEWLTEGRGASPR